ncbi:non-homologous end joining protein Ku [Labrys miyagiensis]|uniref:Non-homologous end joining protein Ku n=1 Tax=Labrys miyagiensis TaxID=346912 RepID=A0ABQ6CNE2_9HYPH|nr:Ku protein [Labrys miyagiensis]GLS19737.1 non-homologous end joining protein Ku [Labrys miyagiensis]
MAVRTFWKGYLKLSLVTCAVAMSPATSQSEKLRFHTLNRQTGNRVQSRYVDAVTGKPVAEEDEVKGYPRGEDDYVMLEDEEIEAVALESTRTIDIQTFVPEDSIDWIWYDTPHYLVPDDKVGEEAFTVIREAMRASKVAGIARLVLYRRERAVMLVPRGKGIVVWTLRYGDEVRREDDYFAGIPEEKPDPDARDLIDRLIKARSLAWSPALIKDPVEDKLKEIIAAKKKGRKAKKPASAPPPSEGNVINLIDALRNSLKGK